METDFDVNKKSWNQRAEIHFDSDFYDNASFIKGRNSLNSIELELLGDVSGKSILHLQCHFGQDTISLNRMGAETLGVDFSENAIEKANHLAKLTGSTSEFICCDIYGLPEQLDKKFDIVFTSYGTIGWLPDLKKWANVVSLFLKDDGVFVMADFHPVVWMMDDHFSHIKYSYFNRERIVEEESTYTDGTEDLLFESISWNHDIAEILNSLITAGLTLRQFNEVDYSPYDCFSNTVEAELSKFRIKGLEKKIPMVYSLLMKKEGK